MSKKVYIFCCNHTDLIWKRGFKKDYYYLDKKFVGYSTIERMCIDDHLKSALKYKNYSFMIESSMVLRTYLESNPDALDIFRQLIKEDRFELLACGEIIPDTNMPCGETIVRNYLYGLKWAEDTLGYRPTTGNLTDAFGVSAQMPQIFNGFGIKWITGLSYNVPNNEYWRGLDGSIVKIFPWLAETEFSKSFGGGTYYQPCKICHGEGCDSCGGYGIDRAFRMGRKPDPSGLNFDRFGFAAIESYPEEATIIENLPELVENDENYEYKFGLYKHMAENELYDWVNFTQVDENLIADQVEGNPPPQTACFVTRIKTKQNVRRLEYKTLMAEMAATIAWQNGTEYPQEKFTELWRNISLACFHDVITGTHNDIGYQEISELYDRCDDLLGKSEVKAALPSQKIQTNTIENDKYTIRFDDCGITEIFDKALNKQIINTAGGYANELILENDYGDPWFVREPNCERVRLGAMNKLQEITGDDEKYTITYKGNYTGDDYRVSELRWEQKVYLYLNSDIIKFKTDIFWNTFDRRIRISFPTFAETDDGIYAIPYGSIKRSRYDKGEYNKSGAADGDWSCVEYFAAPNVALINTGTPSARIENGEMLMSVLRSPTFLGSLNGSHICEGMRDEGNHSFTYALYAYEGDTETQVYPIARKFNIDELCGYDVELPIKITNGNVSVTGYKRAENGEGVIVRLFNYTNAQTSFNIDVAADNIFETNLYEEIIKEINKNQSIIIEPYKIMTILLK